MVEYADVKEAQQTVSSVAYRTPLHHSHTFSRLTGNEIYFKLENMQKTGSFKIRGAYNKVISLTTEEKAKGVVAASAGNHAQGVAFSSHQAGVKSMIVMPENAPLSKVEATQNYGAQVILHGKTYDEAQKKALMLQQEKGATFVHAFDDPYVIAGQGTIGLEIIEQLPDVECVISPVGGGGLLSGIAVALKKKYPHVKLYGVQAARCPSMLRSLEADQPVIVPFSNTVADGIAVRRPGELPFTLIKRYVDDMVTVSELDITQTMYYLLERGKLLAEGAGAVSLAALLYGNMKLKGKKVVVLVSGGNVDLVRLPFWLSHSVRFPHINKGNNEHDDHYGDEAGTEPAPVAISRLYGAENEI